MNPLLDTVEPDWYGNANSLSEKHTALVAKWKGHGTLGLYSRETVESLLAECRKEALLEAAEIVGKSYATFKATEQAHYRLSAEPFVHENFGFNISVVRYSQYANDELRRMAESDKTTMEGGK